MFFKKQNIPLFHVIFLCFNSNNKRFYDEKLKTIFWNLNKYIFQIDFNEQEKCLNKLCLLSYTIHFLIKYRLNKNRHQGKKHFKYSLLYYHLNMFLHIVVPLTVTLITCQCVLFYFFLVNIFALFTVINIHTRSILRF